MFLIVDGHNLLFQMFYGMPSRIVNQDGRAIQGIVGFVGALIKIIKQTNPQYMVVLFDGEHENKRNELLPDYKANRIDYSVVAEEENPFFQLPDIYKALDFMGIKWMETDSAETDDVIAAYAYKYGNDTQIVISSWDSDFFQLITDNISVLRYRGKNTMICDVIAHYDSLIDQNNDFFRNPLPLKEYMDKWDGGAFIFIPNINAF